MKGILIDAENKTITEVELGKKLEDMYRVLRVARVDTATFDDKNDVWVDDDGLNKGLEFFFYYEDGSQPFAGNGLVLGVGKRGSTIDTTLTVDQVKAKVEFLTKAQAYVLARSLEV